MSPSSMSECRVGLGDDVPVDSRCAEEEQSNLGANDELLAKENVKEHNGVYAGDAAIKGTKLRSHLQEQQRKAGNVVAEATPPAMEDEEPKVGGGMVSMVAASWFEFIAGK